MSPKQMTLLLSALLLFGLIRYQPAAAHGGGTAQIVNQPIGDYIITVWMNPDPPRVGDMHLTVALAQNQEPVLNQDVRVEITRVEGGSPSRNAQATHEQSSSRFLYEADVAVPRAGDWDVTVSVAGVADSVSFLAPVASTSWINRPSTAIGAFAIVAVTFAYGLVTGRKR